jgi:rhodanese-related sulfurtransferase
MTPRGVDRLLAAAREHLDRVAPAAAAAAVAEGAVLVDIRPLAQREREGEIPGAVVVGRNVLEWRLDPGGANRLPFADDSAHRLVVVCSAGYASSFAARSLQELGWDATDLDGGFQAWAAAGLPVQPCAGPTPEEAGAPVPERDPD